jgi:benzoyl-CoA reductase/2-hydroxyglutaryl-CoA dehydratase subunit BcrC/BadD/HgdB
MEKPMEAIDLLSSHLEKRSSELSQLKKEGQKIIGYPPGGFLPEELVLAAGAVPVGLLRGGDYNMVQLAGGYICRWMDTFYRGQIGFGISGKNPYYNLLDLMAIPITDNHARALSDVLSCNTKLDIFSFGVPHMKEPATLEYYLHGITRLKSRFEALTGNRITDEKLWEAIRLCNRERKALRKISLLRKSERLPISSADFIALNHGSYLADKTFMVNLLESLYDDLQTQPAEKAEGPRILLTGSTLAIGDSLVLDILREMGGMVVIEEFAEGIKPYWEDVKSDGNPMEALADCYFMKRICPAWFRPGTERLDFLIKLAREFAVNGVIWYHLMFRESYKIESYYFPDRLKSETGLRMLLLESDYDPSEAGPMATRIETFIQTIRRR